MLKEVVKFMRHDRLIAEDEDPIPEHFSDDEDNPVTEQKYGEVEEE